MKSQSKPPTDDPTATPPAVDAEVTTLVALAPPITLSPGSPETFAAGVEAARRIEESADRVRRARAHAKRAKKSLARKAARKQLRRLLRSLHALGRAAAAIGEEAEAQRCFSFLAESSQAAADALAAPRS